MNGVVVVCMYLCLIKKELYSHHQHIVIGYPKSGLLGFSKYLVCKQQEEMFLDKLKVQRRRLKYNLFK